MRAKNPLELFGRLTSPLTATAGALTEAWHQLRIGRVRLLLSLVGVAVAVAAMTLVIALGDSTVAMANQERDRYSGRSGTVTVTISSGSGSSSSGADSGVQVGGVEGAGAADGSGSSGTAEAGSDSGSQANKDDPLGLKVAAAPPFDNSYVAQGMTRPDSARSSWRISQAMANFVERYQVSSWATKYDSQVRFAFPDSGINVNTHVVSSQYGQLHRTALSQGRWFRADDADDASPTLVVSQPFLDRLGISDLTEPVTVTSWSPVRTTFTIVGVLFTPNYMLQSDDTPMEAYVLDESYERWLPADAERPTPSLELWAGAGQSKALKTQAEQDFRAVFGTNAVKVSTNDAAAGQALSSGGFTQVVTIAGVFVMILGALGLINISMVTVRQRIHEIGVRRAFGATSRRIFFSIMLESVVATVMAGIVGIGIAIVAIRYIPLELIFYGDEGNAPPGTAVPAFPLYASIIGLLTASGVGAMAGIIPAIVAVRIKPIDAIRY